MKNKKGKGFLNFAIYFYYVLCIMYHFFQILFFSSTKNVLLYCLKKGLLNDHKIEERGDKYRRK